VRAADVRFLAAAALFLSPVPATLAGAGPRQPVVQSVDLSVPTAPVAFPVEGRTCLAYELHVTNFLPVDVSLSRVRVTAAGDPGVTLADYGNAELLARLARPGLRNPTDREVLGPGTRAVVYLWIPLPNGVAVPRGIENLVEVEVRRPSGPSRVDVEAAVTLSAEPPVALDPPLRGGPWVAISSPLLQGGHRTAIYTVGGRARIPGRFAIDWIRPGADGAIEPSGAPPPDWNGYGTEVLAVADASVAAAMDDIREEAAPAGGAGTPVPLETASGNYVALDLGGGRFAFYEHLKSGSVAVKTGERVTRGQVIGRLGKSGSTSIGPHLHFHVADANEPLAAEGLPFVFTRFEQLGAYRSLEALIDGEKWIPIPGGGAVRERERPGENAVVRFR
jgi:hypothetical protein